MSPDLIEDEIKDALIFYRALLGKEIDRFMLSSSVSADSFRSTSRGRKHSRAKFLDYERRLSGSTELKKVYRSLSQIVEREDFAPHSTGDEIDTSDKAWRAEFEEGFNRTQNSLESIGLRQVRPAELLEAFVAELVDSRSD